MKKRIVGLIGAALLILLPVVAWGAASTTWFTNSAPPASPGVPGVVAEYRVGELIDDQNKVYVQVTEPDLAAGGFDTVLVRIENVTTPGDYIDNFPLPEDAGNTGFFNNSTNPVVPNPITLIPATGAPDTTDLNLEVNPGDTIRVLYIDPNNPSDTSADTAEAMIGPVNLYEDVAGTGAAEYANLKGAFEHINDLVGPPAVTGALGAAVGVANPIIEVEETYDSAVDDNFPFDLSVANMILRAIGTAGRTIVDAQAFPADIMQVTADSVTVDGLTIRNNGGGASGIWVTDGRQGVAIRNCIFEAITGDAIQLGNGVVDPVIENNTIKHATGFNGIWFVGVATRAVVRGNTISDPGARGIGFGGDADESIITHNVVTKAGVDGIALWGTANGANVSNNTITDAGATGIVLGDKADGATFSTNRIENAGFDGMRFNDTATGALIVSNMISSCGWDGIAFGGPAPITYHAVTIIDNEITGMTANIWSCGINFMPADTFQDITISGNKIASNSNGIALTLNNGTANQMVNVKIEGNLIRDNGFNDPVAGPPPDPALYSQCGIYIGSFSPIGVCTGNLISGNQIVGNETGLDIDEPCTPTKPYKARCGSGNIHGFDVTKNQFDDNYIGVAVGHQNNNINRNNFTNHHLFGADARTLGAGQVNATNNWWGHSTGPYHLTNSTGRGDAVSDHVLFAPWLSGPTTSITIGDLTINPQGTGTVEISVETDAIAAFQVGSTGILTISDAGVVDVTDVRALPPYELFMDGSGAAWDVQTAGGTLQVTFAVSLMAGETPVAGPVVAIDIQAHGTDGDTAAVNITSVDVYRDVFGNDLPYQVIPGTITLSDTVGPGVLSGDVNGDSVVDISDAVLIARFAIGEITLTEAEKARGDVVAPFLPAPNQPDISDAAWIAQNGAGMGALSLLSFLPPAMLAVSGGLEFGNYPNPITDVHTTTFEVKGLMAALVEAIKVQIFDLSGRLVYESGEVPGTHLDWHTDNDYGEYLANGTYLYKLYALLNDQWAVSKTKVLVILR